MIDFLEEYKKLQQSFILLEDNKIPEDLQREYETYKNYLARVENLRIKAEVYKDNSIRHYLNIKYGLGL